MAELKENEAASTGKPGASVLPSLLDPRNPRNTKPLKTHADIHGQYAVLRLLLQFGTFPPKAKHLFLGGYVNRGQVPRELFSAPGQPLEYTSFSHIYGFHDECKRRSNTKLWKTCVDCLPIAAIIDDKIFCCHRELSSDLQSTVQSRRISRPTDVPGATLWCDLAFVHGWAENYRDVPVLDYFSAIITL
ncbi:hypothetical protein HPB48_018593 [Haemaphysalis longicornis]|uniref:protein-serine/threonine phosphatase n=1 Tax=Haemaphysalis longicornis TaxID=44386 RepID=A0A9J6FSW0_HAELO|nr:hypothetical protein HPB48_018593 [Haemaphysalis longicornis]